MVRVRRLGVVVVVLLTALVGGLLTQAAGSGRTAQACAAALDCSAAEIDQLSIEGRLEFARAMEAGPAQELLPGFDRWRNIEGVLEFFADHGWGGPGTWVSTVDDGILEGAERGLAIALGRSTDTFGNPGARSWADYLTRLRDGELTTRAKHDAAWGDAEQPATDWGTTMAAQQGRVPSAVQQNWYQFTQLYRFMLRNRPAALDLIARVGTLLDPDLAHAKVPFYDWLTDVRTDLPAHRGGELFYQLVRGHAIRSGATMAELMLGYLPVAYREFCSETGTCTTNRGAA